MKVQLMINGKLEDVEIDENGGITALGYKEENNLTGWERAENDDEVWYINASGTVWKFDEDGSNFSNMCYRAANYFSNDTLAENIGRAQTIWRKLLRWQVENDIPINLNEKDNDKYYIYYDTDRSELRINYTNYENEPFALYFLSYKIAEKCMSEFYDDLLWLATRFKIRMDG